jgi:dolichol-phosphate mannosyltransferase
MQVNRSTICFVVPIFNEEDCLPEMHRRLNELRAHISGEFDLSVIYVDDGSIDQSREILNQLEEENDWVTAKLLTRNFGHQIAVTAGLDYAIADYVAIIDGDLQDPPELVPEMVEQLRRSSDRIVFGQRRVREGESKFKLLTARFFYRTIRRLSGLDIPLDTGDFRVLDRRAAEVMRSLREHNRFLRGLAPWTGLKSSSFLYDRDTRYAGETKYTLKKMFVLAFNAIVSFSITPLRALQAFGITVAITGAVVFAGSLFVPLFGHSINLMWTVISFNTFTTGVVIASIGIVGGYVHRIQDEVRGRPLYLLEEK